MQTLFALIVLGLIMLGLISIVEMVVKAIQARRNPSTEPINYDSAIEAASNGLSGFEPDQAASVLGRIGHAIAHFLEHFLHH